MWRPLAAISMGALFPVALKTPPSRNGRNRTVPPTRATSASTRVDAR